MSETRYERLGEVGILRIANASRMNPLTPTLQIELREHLAHVRADTAVRALLLTGEGRAFCVGADLGSMGAVHGDTRTLGQRTGDTMLTQSNPLIEELRALPVPVVCALNGAVAGGGVGLALAGDLVIAARSAYFYLPFVPRLGLVPDLGTTWFLERLLGRTRAMGLTLLGDRLSAEDAARWGLVWACVDDAALGDEALALARRLARLPAHGVVEARRAFDAAASNPLAHQLAYEAGRQREMIDRPEFAEGVRAFMEKREPRFPSRPT